METTFLGASIGDIVIAIGALGTAAYGIVDGFKFFRGWAAAGFRRIQDTLGTAVYQSLEIAYGTDFEKILTSQYIKDRTKGDIVQSLRQGTRVGLTPENAGTMARSLGIQINPDKLTVIAQKIATGGTLNSSERNILSRFELAVDARIDAALSLAETRYVATMQLRASIVAISLAFAATYFMETTSNVATVNSSDFLLAFVVGVMAVPIAPIAKDVASGLQSAARAVGRRK